MVSVLFLMALAHPAGPASESPTGTPPVQALAVMDAKGRMTLTRVQPVCGTGPMTREVEVNAEPKRGDKEPFKIKARITKMVLTVVELQADYVEAYTVDGKAIPAAKLVELLAKERTVLLSLDGKKIDPFYLELYKEGTIVLVPPAELWHTDVGFAPVGVAMPKEDLPAPREKLDKDKE
jgi:hypothetical protein